MKRRFWLYFLLTPIALTANPEGAQVAHGDVKMHHPSADVLHIETGDKAIIDWKSFSIAAQEQLRFLQPSVKSAVLNRVIGSDMSRLDGLLEANGRVYLINPQGIVIGKEGVINAAAFIASTLQLSESDFLNGNDLLFQGDSSASIINYGTIKAWDGNVALLAHLVENRGTIGAPQGAALLGAGQEILLKPEGSELLFIRAPSTQKEGGVDHQGSIQALQTEIKEQGLYAFGIRSSGRIDALDLVEVGGRILLTSGKGGASITGALSARQGDVQVHTEGLLTHTGAMDVSGKQGGEIDIVADRFLNAGLLRADGEGKGGTVHVGIAQRTIETQETQVSAQGEQGGEISVHSGIRWFSSGTYNASSAKGQGGHIELFSDDIHLAAAHVEASGDKGGGTVLIGGDYQGVNSPFPNAQKVEISHATTINADALSEGDGGKIIVWSDNKTEFWGHISAAGGIKGGNGGFIEVSGKEVLVCDGELRAHASLGNPGQVLLDPQNVIVDAVLGIYPQYNLVDPNVGGGTLFGATVASLGNGNVVVTKPGDNFSAANAGAVYLYNGNTAALISTLVGSTANDQIGNNGVTVLTNNNFVVSSTLWDNGATSNAGAATWGSGTTGVSGTVSSANSLVGSTTSDQVSSGGVTALTNGNYVVASPLWDNGATNAVGAATWGNGTTGITGTVTSSNSLVGSTAADQVSLSGVIALTNGNYVVGSRVWDNGATADAGAATWGNGTTGITGTVTSSNSLVGSTASDQVSSSGVTALTNGNYVVRSSLWDNGAVVNAGAATWGNGTTGITGTVTSSNSLVGSTAADQVSSTGVTALTNGNYVVRSALWDNGAVVNAGAATWGNGTTGVTGTVTSSNSLVGSTATDQVSISGVTALTNGNYVVGSELWDNGVVTNAGAATWGNGTTGITGTVTTSNSLVGSTASDNVSTSGVIALTNGNYVVGSALWSGGGVAVGAATWGNGTTGITGTVTSSNSLIGSTSNDRVGSGGGVALTNGNYVVFSPLWDNGATADVGAATWGNGTTGITGTVTSSNSLIGSTLNDNVSDGGGVALTNGNYVVFSTLWDNGATADVGAATFGSGTAGVTGTVSSSNSLIGSTASDQVGSGSAVTLANGNYVVTSPLWDNGALNSAGAATFGSGTAGITGTITNQNSLVGATASTSLAVISDSANADFIGAFDAESSGRVTVGLVNPSQLTYTRAQANTMTITPGFITQTLNDGTAVSILANDTITISSPIVASNPSGNGGNLSLTAGKSLLLNANITTDNGGLTLIANDLLANGVVNSLRTAGPGVVTLGSGVTLNTGTGDLSIILRDGAGKTNSTSGDITVGTGASTQTSGGGVVNMQAAVQNIVLNDNSTIRAENGWINLEALLGSVHLNSNTLVQATGSAGITFNTPQANITLGNASTVQTNSGNLLLTAGMDISGNNFCTIRSTTGDVTLVVDALNPNSPAIGTGKVTLPQATLATGGALRIFTARRSLNTLPATINGVAFVEGIKFLDTPIEEWGVYYPHFSGVPFTLFYKETGTASLPQIQDFYTSINELFQIGAFFNDQLLFKDALYYPAWNRDDASSGTYAVPYCIGSEFNSEELASCDCHYMVNRSYNNYLTQGPIYWATLFNKACKKPKARLSK